MKTKILGSRKAMTLMEVLASLVILSIILLPMYNVLMVALRSWDFSETKTEISQNARIGLERMSTELRQMKKAYRGTNDTKVDFWIDEDRVGEDPEERVIYQWLGAGSPLNRTKGAGAAEAIAEHVQDFKIKYRDENGNPLVTPLTRQGRKKVRLIIVNLTLNHDGQTMQMRISAHPRNM